MKYTPPMPRRDKRYAERYRHSRTVNRLTSLALIALVVGIITSTGVHNLSSSNAATKPVPSPGYNSASRLDSSDTTAPTVNFTSPLTSSVHGDHVLIGVSATDEPGGSGMASVTIYLDGTTDVLKNFSGGGPYSFTWDSSAAGRGSHTLSAVATDKAGNNSTALLTVNVY